MVFKSTWDWFQKCEIHSNCNDISWGSGDKLSMFINVQTNPLVWLGIMIFGGWILFTCWCPICPLVGVLVVHLWDIVHFLDLIYKVWVYHQQKNETVPTAMGYPEPTCLTYCATTKNMVETDHCAATEAHVGPIASSCKTPSVGTSGLAMVITHGSYPCCPYLVMVNNGE